jgi:hypothetical protein
MANKSKPNTVTMSGNRGTTIAKSMAPDRSSMGKVGTEMLKNSSMKGDKGNLDHSISGASIGKHSD